MDWKSILSGIPVGAVVGYLGTLISDPIKNHINDWRERRRLRRNLYSEVAHNYLSLLSFLDPTYLALLEARFGENIEANARFQVYEHAKAQNHLFLELKDWSQITHIYEFLLQIVNSKVPSHIKASQGKGLLAMIEESILSGSLSLKLFSRIKPDISGLMRQIKNGARRRSLDVYGTAERTLSDEIEACLQERRRYHGDRE
jgi:hypothetical protein